MRDEAWQALAALFDELVELELAERARRLALLHREQPALATRLEGLLAADESSQAVVDRELQGLIPELTHSSPVPGTVVEAGTRLGPFCLVEPMGEGGMGEVWRARRVDGSYEQIVAIKLLKRGLDSDSILRRFIQERAILARLQHPNIVHLIDGGLSPDGRPWYAMEAVEGLPVTQFAAQESLGVAERVALLIKVCQAVAYAHARLVVHRDLKPANILVDAHGQPFLLDFGIAKLLEETADGERTRTGMRILSPAYAAPEQVLGEPVTVATDVYGLGLILYELLTGQLPSRSDAALTADPDRSAPNLSASRCLARADVNTIEQAYGPDADSRRLARELSGDLDLILAMALRPEPERRYASVNDLAADLQAWLERKPISARPDSAAYRTRRFVRRHLIGVSAVASALFALAIGLSLALWQAGLARDQAYAAAIEAERANRSLDYMVGMFHASDPRRGNRVNSIDELLQQGRQRALSGLGDDPLLQGSVLINLAQVHSNRSEFEQALELNLTARERLLGLLTPPHPLLARSAYMLGVHAYHGGEHLTAVEWLEESVGQAEQLGMIELQIDARSLMANIHSGEASLAEFDALIELSDQALGSNHVYSGILRSNRAVLAMNLGDYALAESSLRQAIPILQFHDETGRVELVNAWTHLAGVLDALGQYEEAAHYFELALEGSIALWGPDHSSVARVLFSQGILFSSIGQHAAAETNFRQVLESDQGIPILIAHSHRYLGIALREQGRLDQAIVEFAAAREAYLAMDGPLIQYQALRALADEGMSRALSGDSHGLTLLGDAIAGIENFRGAEHYDLIMPLINLGQALIRFERLAEAIPELERARSIASQLFGDEHQLAQRAIALLRLVADSDHMRLDDRR